MVNSNTDTRTATQGSKSTQTSKKWFHEATKWTNCYLLLHRMVQTLAKSHQEHQIWVKSPITDSVLSRSAILERLSKEISWPPKTFNLCAATAEQTFFCQGQHKHVQECDIGVRNQMQEHWKSKGRDHSTKVQSQNATTLAWSQKAQQTWWQVSPAHQMLHNPIPWCNSLFRHPSESSMCGSLWQGNPIGAVKAVTSKSCSLCAKERTAILKQFVSDPLLLVNPNNETCCVSGNPHMIMHCFTVGWPALSSKHLLSALGTELGLQKGAQSIAMPLRSAFIQHLGYFLGKTVCWLHAGWRCHGARRRHGGLAGHFQTLPFETRICCAHTQLLRS